MARKWTARSWIALAGIGAVAAGCASKRVAPGTPAQQPPTMIALLPDPETKVTGRIHVFNEFGAIDVSTPRGSLIVRSTAAPGPIAPLDEDEVTRAFGPALEALPPAPKHFILRFKFESDTLTDESTALIPEILDAVRGLKVPEVVIIGHTDTMGDRKSNVALGMRRAWHVRGILIDAGLPAATLDVTSHGEADLLIKTRDNTPEPRNRRVEITVR